MAVLGGLLWAWGREPFDSSDFRAELVRRFESDGLSIASFRFVPAALVVFGTLNFRTLSLNTEELGFAEITPDGNALFVSHPNHSQLSRSVTEETASFTHLDGTSMQSIPRKMLGDGRCFAINRELSRIASYWPGAHVRILDLKSAGITEVPVADGRLKVAEYISWSPHSSELVFECRGEIYIHNLVSRQSRHLVTGFSPAWSPDGRWIAYCSAVDEAMITDPGATVSRHLMQGVRVLNGFCWSPDSRYLVFSKAYRFQYPLGASGFLSVYRMRDGARCKVREYSFKGVGDARDYGWVFNSKTLIRRFSTQ